MAPRQYSLLVITALFAAASIGFPPSASGQSGAPLRKLWDKTYGAAQYEELTFILPLENGGALLGGWSESGAGNEKSEASRGGADYWIVRVDAAGEKLWDRRYGASEDDELIDAVQTTDGGFLLAGHSFSPADPTGDRDGQGCGQTDAWLVRVSADGALVWQALYGGSGNERVAAVAPAQDGGFLLACDTDSETASCDVSEDNLGVGEDYWLVRIDAEGALVWEERAGGAERDVASDVLPTADGGWLVCGHSRSNAGGDKSEPRRGPLWDDFWLVRLNDAGQIIWDKTLGGEDDDFFVKAAAAPGGGWFIVGSSESPVGFDKTAPNYGLADVWAARIDENGNKLWDQSYGGEREDVPADLALLPDGGFLILASSSSNAGAIKSEDARSANPDFWLLRAVNDGNLVWDKTYGGQQQDFGAALAAAPQNRLLAAGYSASSIQDDKSEQTRGIYDYWLLGLQIDSLSAGPDTTVCPPAGLFRLSARIPYEAAEIRWTPANLLDDPGSSAPAVLNLQTTTTFTLTVVVNETDTLTDEVTVTIAESTPVFRSIVKRDVNNQADGAIVLNAAKGLPPYEYRVDPESPWQSGRVFRALTPGLYVAEARDSNGCAVATEARIY